jgi:hypothetical protein
METSELAALPDEQLLEIVQRQTFNYFWDGAHPVSGLAPDRCTTRANAADDKVAIGGSGFGIMAILVAVERGWVTRDAAIERLRRMLDLLTAATCYHGAYAHFVNGRTAATIPFYRKDDGGDLVETSFLCMGLLCARQYFNRDTQAEQSLRGRITWLWEEVEWDWYTQDDSPVLYWHWSPNNGWAMDHEIRGWNECLITYVLAAAAPRYPVDPIVYHRGFAAGRTFLNGKRYYDIELPLGCRAAGRCSSRITPSADSTRVASKTSTLTIGSSTSGTWRSTAHTASRIPTTTRAMARCAGALPQATIPMATRPTRPTMTTGRSRPRLLLRACPTRRGK